MSKTFFFLLLAIFFHKSFSKEDPSTFSNYFQIKQKHIEGHFQINFNTSTIISKVKIFFESLMDGELIILDSKSLKINSIIDPDTGLNINYEYDTYYSLPSLGTPLKIYKSYSKGQNISIIINYSTTKEGGATQWLTANMTTGKKYPFMFTQGESILSRELIPIQDTPNAKITISLGITVIKPLRALYSGLYQNYIDNGNSITYFYNQKIPIPSYLIALAAGNIEERTISDRVKVYAEPEIVDSAKNEFSNTEKFIQIGETYTIPYEWGEYNILVLPKSFPYGGMENPTLTFATPSILAGDKSLANVIAHEISHSWSGNLVTMSSWKDFWLNEGFTVFIERKIAEMLIDENMSKLQAIFGYRAMINDIINLGESKTFSSLNPYLIGRHPDEAFSEISYEKGFNFIYRTQNIVNKYANFDLFKLILKKYFSKFKYQAIESKKWKEHLYNCINETFNQSIYNNIIKEIDFDYWVNTPGIPKYKNDFNNSYAKDADKYVNDFFDKKYDKSFNETFSKWHTNIKLYYLLQIHTNEKGVDDEGLKYLGETLNLKEGYNSEINNEFFKIMLDNKKLTYIEELKAFLGKFGRMKFLRPLYRGWGSIDKVSAYTCFEYNKYWYHPIAVRLIEMDFKKLN